MNAYSYDDLYLIPQCSVLDSRSDADTSFPLGGHTFKLPIVPANMKCVMNETHAKWFSENNYFYVMHRFDMQNCEFVSKANEENWKNISISLGVRDLEGVHYERMVKSGLRVDFITVDIAHAHCNSMRRVLRMLKTDFPNTFVIAGNVATARASQDMESWGADAVKCGIGGGSPCSTKFKTGFNVPMFTCVQDCSRGIGIPVIADGGVKFNGDITKALVAGASMVMCGGLFVGCKDSPAESINNCVSENGYTKRYYGSASERNKGFNKHIEGIEVNVPGNGFSYEEKLKELTEDLSSAISYSGGSDLSSFLGVGYNICR